MPRQTPVDGEQTEQSDRTEDHEHRHHRRAEPDRRKRAPPELPVAPAKPDVAEPTRDLQVAAPPAQALLPQPGDLARLFRPYDGAGVKYHALAGELDFERRRRVLGQRARVDPTADRLQARPREQLGAAGETRLRAEHVLRAAGGRLRGHVLERHEAVEVILRAAAQCRRSPHRRPRRRSDVSCGAVTPSSGSRQHR